MDRLFAFAWWTAFVRIYQKDLTRLDYSSLVSGQDHAALELRGLSPVKGGVVVAGYTKNETKNKELPSTNAPAWAGREISGQRGLLALLPF